MKSLNNSSKIQSLALRCAVFLSAILTVGILVSLVAYILIKGVPNLSWSLFSISYTSENVSLFPALLNTITMTFLSLLVAMPLGIFSAIYLVEYAKRGNRLVSIIRITSETLAGIPSIVYGLFGFLLFVIALGFGYFLAEHSRWQLWCCPLLEDNGRSADKCSGFAVKSLVLEQEASNYI